MGPDAADLFDAILSVLCRDTLPLTIVPQTGEPFWGVTFVL